MKCCCKSRWVGHSKGNPILFLSLGPSNLLSPPPQAREEHPDIYGKRAQASTLVTILVTDVNDNKPRFYNCSLSSCDFSASARNNFTGSIIEHSSTRLPVSNLSIVAYDPDKVGRSLSMVLGCGADVCPCYTTHPGSCPSLTGHQQQF